jgi:DNA polymerase elongation subunit (family B)/predicted RNA-binding Zn-ribbon protein involved in translation (DUF1610 family)
MNIVYFDLETTPMLGYAWQMWKTNLLSIEKNSGLICFAYKENDGATKVLSTRTHTEKQMVKTLWELFDKADVLCAQNGDNFDIKVANKLFIKHKLKPPSPYKTIDTVKIARKYFRFDSNKLDYLAQFILGEGKLSTEMGLWFSCMEGDVSSLKRMERYCKHDVNILYRVYQELKGWHTGHPNFKVYNGTTHKCPVCGGETQRRGFMVTRVGRYQRYQCKGCGAWSKGERVPHGKVIS